MGRAIKVSFIDDVFWAIIKREDLVIFDPFSMPFFYGEKHSFESIPRALGTCDESAVNHHVRFRRGDDLVMLSDRPTRFDGQLASRARER